MPIFLGAWALSLPSLPLRIAMGAAFFVVMAIVDLARHGRAARRWREYSFLLIAVIAALYYGVLNDQITVGLSPEYFAYGKGLADTVGPDFTRHPIRFRWEAAKVGMQATWSAGLFIGVALLLANNPSPRRPQVPFLTLFRALPLVFLICVACAALLGVAGYRGSFTRFSEDFSEMLSRDQFRPRRFMAVYGIHLGGYVGGVIGTIIAVVYVRKQR